MKAMMKILFAAAFLIVVPPTARAAEDIQQTFQKAILEEEANRNLEAAIQGYNSVLEQLAAQRQLAATSVFRLGECYRKLGKTNEAFAQYQRIVREFNDQTVLANLSRQNLLALGVKETTTAKSDPVPGSADEEAHEIELIKGLIKNSPDLINAQTPLRTAASKGQLRVATFLIENGADVNANGGALKPAAQAGNKAMVELLLRHGADVNLPGAGDSPLHVAVSQGYRAIAEVLIAAKADVNASNSGGNGLTPLHLAADRGDAVLIETLIKHGANANAADVNGRTPLFMAQLHGRETIIEQLLRAGADIDAKDEKGRTVLYLAVSRHQTAICEALLKRGANPNTHVQGELIMNAQRAATLGARESNFAVSADGFTPLHIATIMGFDDVVKLLLAHKAEVNAKTTGGQTPLNLALDYAGLGVVRLLLDHGADVNHIVDNSTGAPTVEAAWRGEQFLAAVLARQPNLELRNEQGLTVLQQVLQSVLTSTSLSPTSLRPRIERIVEMLLDAGADPNVTGPQNGETPLHLAVTLSSKGIVRALLNHKANPNLTDNKDRTPLDYIKSPPPRSGRRASGGGQSNREEVGQEIARALRQAGATEYPQRSTSILIGRDTYYTTLFSKTPGREDRRTLIEAIGTYYRERLAATGYGAPAGGLPAAMTLPPVQLPYSPPGSVAPPATLDFPDFSKIVIHRQRGEEDLRVDLDKILQSADCSKDIPLEWGDMIEIPEKEHKLNESWPGLPFEQSQPLQQCLQRRVSLTVKTKTGMSSVTLFLRLIPKPGFQGDLNPNLERTINVTGFRLDEALRLSNMLLSSSDQTRVKVKRMDPEKKEMTELTANLFDPAQALWLRDGDVIDVPEK